MSKSILNHSRVLQPKSGAENATNAENVNSLPENTETKKTYAPTDYIPCVSIVTGELLMKGAKTGILYKWSDRDDVTDIEYQDLVSAIRSRSNYIYKPLFLIEDEDVVRDFDELYDFYNNMYTVKDLRGILNLNPRDMKATILALPEGAKKSIQNIAATMISENKLDSIQKIKILDEIFDTNFMVMTELFS